MTATQLENMEVLAPATLVAQIEGLTCPPAETGCAIGKAFGRLFAAIGHRA